MSLRNLESLNLSHNQIFDLNPLVGLYKLKHLNLAQNNIIDIAPLSNLKQLELLVLSSNEINDLTPLVNLDRLQGVFLVKNKVTNLKPLINLIKKGIPISFEEIDSSKRIRLRVNYLVHPPRSIVEQGNEAILNYFKQLKEQGAEQLNEAKLIIVGEPAAGKTTCQDPTGYKLSF